MNSVEIKKNKWKKARVLNDILVHKETQTKKPLLHVSGSSDSEIEKIIDSRVQIDVKKSETNFFVSKNLIYKKFMANGNGKLFLLFI